jgi:hypothetical protein
MTATLVVSGDIREVKEFCTVHLHTPLVSACSFAIALDRCEWSA